MKNTQKKYAVTFALENQDIDLEVLRLSKAVELTKENLEATNLTDDELQKLYSAGKGADLDKIKWLFEESKAMLSYIAEYIGLSRQYTLKLKKSLSSSEKPIDIRYKHAVLLTKLAYKVEGDNEGVRKAKKNAADEAVARFRKNNPDRWNEIQRRSRKKNPKKRYYVESKSNAKKYIKEFASREELEEMLAILKKGKGV